MNHVNAFIHQLLARTGDTYHVQLVQAWQDVMGKLAEHTRLESYDNGCVTIGAYDPQWLQELHFLAPTIQQQINAYFHKAVVNHVRIKLVARRSQRATKEVAIRRRQSSGVKQLPERYVQVLNTIANSDLRYALYKLYCNRDSPV